MTIVLDHSDQRFREHIHTLSKTIVIEEGDIVQITRGKWVGVSAIVDEVKNWGVIVDILIPASHGLVDIAPMRLPFTDCERIGISEVKAQHSPVT